MTPSERDDDWLDLTYAFIKAVGGREYAKVLLKEALADHGYGPADVPDDPEAVLQIAMDLYESGKKIRREAFHPAEVHRMEKVE